MQQINSGSKGEAGDLIVFHVLGASHQIGWTAQFYKTHLKAIVDPRQEHTDNALHILVIKR